VPKSRSPNATFRDVRMRGLFEFHSKNFLRDLRRRCSMARSREFAESVDDSSDSVLCGVLIAHCSDGGGVSHPVHQLNRGRPSGRRQGQSWWRRSWSRRSGLPTLNRARCQGVELRRSSKALSMTVGHDSIQGADHWIPRTSPRCRVVFPNGPIEGRVARPRERRKS
jgi:hypothetical protein